jgi:hypothetical protein
MIAAPVAYYFMSNWLHGFAYQITIGPQIFVVAILMSSVIAAWYHCLPGVKSCCGKPSEEPSLRMSFGSQRKFEKGVKSGP